eukprot:857-Alexandrium_andersonii.AAC.1
MAPTALKRSSASKDDRKWPTAISRGLGTVSVHVCQARTTTSTATRTTTCAKAARLARLGADLRGEVSRPVPNAEQR